MIKMYLAEGTNRGERQYIYQQMYVCARRNKQPARLVVNLTRETVRSLAQEPTPQAPINTRHYVIAPLQRDKRHTR